jgi:two-component system NtrC family sensor kinase
VRLRNLIRLGLAAKLTICLVAGPAAFFALFGYINLRMERRQSQDLILQAADRITDLILRSTHYEMLHHDQEALYNVIHELGTRPGIRRIRIFNKEGRITISTDAAEVNSVVDQTAESCYGCHAQSAPLIKLNRPDRARIFTDKHGERILGVIRPIENSAACTNAGCHVHPASQRVLGVVDANLSLATVDAQLAQHQAALAWFLVGAAVFGSLLAMVFIWIVVYRPVHELILGTHRVAGGDLAYRLRVGSDDELGDLAASFNKMTEEVAGEQAQIEEQVRRKTAELERIHKTLFSSEKMASIGKLAAAVAHEINNPLFGILTYARLVQKELLKHEIPGRDELTGQLETIERASKRCGDLVKNLLRFGRQAPSHREPNDIDQVVRRAVALVKHKLELQNVELREDLAGNLPPIECAADQIQQVLIVLLVNACEAMPKGGSVEISSAFDATQEQIVLRVKDTGDEIPEDVLPRIFDPFFTTKEDQNRTDLGLAVAHSIVERHAGEISVRSITRQGTEFTVTLPVAALVASVGAKVDEQPKAIRTGRNQWQLR